MLFNSTEFAIFLPIVFLLYWLVTYKNLKTQNILLLIAGYVFYGWWDWRFLLLLTLLSLANYFIGIKIDNNETIKKRKIWLITGIVTNIGILGIFKYYNFFIDSFIDLVSLFGYALPRSTTKIILPVGISFYVFLSLSYIIDIYKKNLTANRKIVEVLLTLSFFPIILAGPIQRPASLLPQISKHREFHYSQASDGLKQILWGLFTKIVIADNLAVYVDDFFLNYSSYAGSSLFLGGVFYTIQIYTDFSGYSNMAIGIAKLFGFSLMQNFAYPYFSRDIVEFWKRWHISLTSWFRDYVFLPLSFTISWRLKGEKVLFIKTDLFLYIVASAITWFLTGLWHGAKYTYIIWGIIHGFFLIIYKWQLKPRKRILKNLGISNNNFFVVFTETTITIIIIMITWVFFRAENLREAVLYLNGIFSNSIFSIPEFRGMKMGLIISFLVLLFLITEWFGREQQYAISHLGITWKRPYRWAMYSFIIFLIGMFMQTKQTPFLYFQF
jgi:alginate O-acetyltransferase complex protein AlgI